MNIKRIITMDDLKNIEVSKDSGIGKEQESVSTSIPYDPYAKVQRLLSEEDMSSPAVQKLLLNENARMNKEIEKLHLVEEKYHNRDKEAAILEEKLKKSTVSSQSRQKSLFSCYCSLTLTKIMEAGRVVKGIIKPLSVSKRCCKILEHGFY